MTASAIIFWVFLKSKEDTNCRKFFEFSLSCADVYESLVLVTQLGFHYILHIMLHTNKENTIFCGEPIFIRWNLENSFFDPIDEINHSLIFGLMAMSEVRRVTAAAELPEFHSSHLTHVLFQPLLYLSSLQSISWLLIQAQLLHYRYWKWSYRFCKLIFNSLYFNLLPCKTSNYRRWLNLGWFVSSFRDKKLFLKFHQDPYSADLVFFLYIFVSTIKV